MDNENIGRYSATRIKAIRIAMKINIAGSISATKFGDLRIHIIFVKFGNAPQHGGQRSAGLAHFDHFQRQVRNQTCRSQSIVQRLPFANQLRPASNRS